MSESEDRLLVAKIEISPIDANNWWRKNHPLGAFLNGLMLAFVVSPVALVFKEYYTLSFVIFALMVPYALLVRKLAVLAVRTHLAKHPESMLEFREAGVIL